MALNIRQPEDNPHRHEVTQGWTKIKMGDEPVKLTTRSGKTIGRIIMGPQGVFMKFANGQIALPLGQTTQIGHELQPGFFGDNEAYISAHHCEINVSREGDDIKVWIRDLNSSNGTSCEVEEDPSLAAVTLAGGQEGSESRNDGNFQILTSISGGVLKGYRENEDSVYMNPNNRTIAIADGMGQYGNGAEASEIVIDSVDWGVSRKFPAKTVIDNAVTRLGSNPDFANSGYGATLAMAREYQQDGQTFVECCHVGDAAIYVIHPTEGLKYVSKDQSRIQNMIDRSIVEPTARYTHPENNVVLSAIKPSGLTLPAEIRRIEVKPGTIVLVVSDGISDYVTPEEVTEIVMKYGKNAPGQLKALAESRHNESGGFSFRFNGQMVRSELTGGDNIAIGFMVVGA